MIRIMMIIKVAVVAAFLHVMWSSGGTGSAIQIFDDDGDGGDDGDDVDDGDGGDDVDDVDVD